MKVLTRFANPFKFSKINHIRGKPSLVQSKEVKLRGIHIESTRQDNPNMIFIPEIFDQAESWLQFFTNPNNKIIHERNVYILYPRNFGNSDHCDSIDWEEMADDVARFMFENKISMATLAGHGIGAKIALAASCYHFDKVTGYIGIDSTPMNQYYHEGSKEIRNIVNFVKDLNTARAFPAISQEMKANILCPRWREIFLNNLVKGETGYQWNFNLNAIAKNLALDRPSNMLGWAKSIGLYPGRSTFIFPEYSRFVFQGTNTQPMHNVCPKLEEYLEGIYAIQGDDSPLSHWMYELQDEVNPFCYKMTEFIRHKDGVHSLLRSRAEVGSTYIPDINNARVNKDDFAGDRIPAHYHHNWRFNNIYQK